MTLSFTISDQFNLLRQRLPIEQNSIKSLGREDDFSLYEKEVVGLEIYCSPFLIEDKINMINRRYIAPMKLNLIAKKLNTDTILVTGKTNVPVL